jgi:hypothetical protein
VLRSLLALLAASPQVIGTATCPSPADVSAAADAMGYHQASRKRRAEIVGGSGGVSIVLRESDGHVIGVRTLDASASCQDLANAAALILFAWDQGALPTAELPAPVLPQKATSTARVATDITPGPAKRGLHLDLGCESFGSWASDGVALGGGIYGALISDSSDLGAAFALTTEASRNLSMQGGIVSWNRWAAWLGGQWRRKRGTFAADLEADLALGLISASGSGFSGSQSSLSVDPGLRAGGKLLWMPGATHVWVGLFAAVWPVPHLLSLATTQGGTTVPQAELLLGLGLEQELF